MQRFKLYWPLALCVLTLGTLLHSPVLEAGYTLDDFAQTAMLDDYYPSPRASWNLFTFADGSAEDAQALTTSGYFPWWAHPEVRLAMFRPLSSWLTALDHRWFGNDTVAQHVHSFVWWWILGLLVAALFRRLLPAAWGLLALAIFAFDQPHPTVLGWLANRTALLSCTFGVMALLAYLRHRGAWTAGERPNGVRWAVLASFCMALALAAGEYGLSCLGFFVAYEALARGESAKARAKQLLWVVVPAACFLAARTALHFGGRHSGVYLDPLGDPALFGTAVLKRFPVLMADYAVSLRADYWSFGLPFSQALHDAGAVDASWLKSHGPWRSLHELIGLVTLVAYAACLGWLAKKRETERYGHVLWLGLGALLSTLPVSASLPSSRLTLVPAVGASAVIACLLMHCIDRVRDARARFVPRASWAVASAGIVFVHFLVGPAQTAIEAQLFRSFSPHFKAGAMTAPYGYAGTMPKRAVIVSTGDPTSMIYSGMIRHMHGLESPESVWVMSGNRFAITLERPNPQGLVVRYAPGVSLLSEPFEQMFRSPADPFKVGDRVSVGDGGMTVEILSVSATGPTAMYFHFDRPLEDPSWLFLMPTEEGLRPFTLPEVGESVALAAPPLAERIVPYLHQPKPRKADAAWQHASVIGLPDSH